MRGFRSTLGISSRPSVSNLLIIFAIGAVLFSSGCSGLVSGTNTIPGNTALTISNIAAGNATVTAVAVSWQTNLAANSQVEYGTTTGYGATSPMDNTMVTSHQQTLGSLKPAALYHYRVHSIDAANGAAVSNDQTFTTVADTTAPTVSITSPVANATLSGTVSLSANASDDVAVASVQFKVDNANTGAAITAAPYNYSLNTTTLSDGNHVLTAVATDTSGNAATSAGVAVKVNNATTAPSITSLNPTSGVVGTAVTIAGANFGATQGTSTVTFNGAAATATSWNATSIVVAVPAGATTGNVVVTVGGVASNGVGFTVTVPAPSISSLNPTSGLVGASVTIAGANFGATQGTSTIKFNGTTATPTSWSATSIVAPVPAAATTGNVVVTVGGVASNGVSFSVTVPAPSITSLNPTSGVISTSVTISGANFGATQGTSTVKFNGIAATPTSWSTTSIVVPVPAGATTGNVVVTVGGVASNGVNFTVTVPGPSVTNLNPSTGVVGTPVTIAGANFGATQGTSTVTFNGIAAVATSWSATGISASVPAGATTGNVVVTVGGVISNGVSFTVTVPAPSISSLNPTSGLVGASVTISGANFGATQGTSTVKFNGTTATPTSWSATSIVVPVPAAATTGNVVVTVGGVASNGVSFTVTVPAPSISSLNPTSGLVGASVTIAGANFGATQGTSTIKFNGTTATPTSWSATSIVAPVPAAATTGNVVVTVGGVASNGVSFTVTVTVPAPSISSLNPTSGTVGTSVTISGANFGATQGTSAVTFNGTAATPTSWSGTSITVAVPSGATTGNVVVTVGGVASNGVSFTVTSGTGSSMGPLVQSGVNTRYFVDPAGNAVFLSGSHTWDDFQDTDTNVGSTPAAFDFNAYVTFLKAHNQNVTILWHKDLPEYCGWNVSGSTWRMAPWPWLRPGPGVATDGNPKFDLTQFNQPYFDRLLARVQQLQQNGIYAIIELFDGNQLTSARCSTDGYAYTGANNVNGVDDGYTSGAAGVNSVTMTANNAITNVQDAYVKKVIDTLNAQPNVIWEIAEEQPGASMTWWAPHMMGLVRAYEGGGTFEGTTYTAKAFQHPVGIGSLNYFNRNDGTLYGSAATWVAPSLNTTGFPENVAVNNQGKVAINDSDHSLGYSSFVNSNGTVQDQNLRGFIWENITQGAEGVVFMDPYEIFWQGNPTRNNCANASHQVCTGVDTKYDNFRSSMGWAQQYVNAKMDLLKATPQAGLASTGFCLADNASMGAEYLVYAPNGGTFTVNLSATTRALNVEWFNPLTGATTAGAAITGGSTKSFTAPFSGDAVLYIVDAAGHN